MADDDRKKARAERAAQLRKQQESAERRRRIAATAVISVLAVLLIGGGAVYIKHVNDSKAAAEAVTKPTKTVDDGVVVDPAEGKTLADKAPTVEVFEDFLCPYCEQFETANSEQLQTMAADGEIKLIYYPLAILDTPERKHYSSRAASAAICSLQSGGSKSFLLAHNALYTDPPQESDSSFPTSKEIAAKLEKAGVTDASSCITSDTYASWARRLSGVTSDGGRSDDSNTLVAKRGITGTPTLMINGKTVDSNKVNIYKAEDVKAAIDAAKA